MLTHSWGFQQEGYVTSKFTQTQMFRQSLPVWLHWPAACISPCRDTETSLVNVSGSSTLWDRTVEADAVKRALSTRLSSPAPCVATPSLLPQALLPPTCCALQSQARQAHQSGSRAGEQISKQRYHRYYQHQIEGVFEHFFFSCRKDGLINTVQSSI